MVFRSTKYPGVKPHIELSSKRTRVWVPGFQPTQKFCPKFRTEATAEFDSPRLRAVKRAGVPIVVDRVQYTVGCTHDRMVWRLDRAILSAWGS